MRKQARQPAQGVSLRHLTGFLRKQGGAHARALILYSILVNVTALAPSFHMMQVYDRVLSSGSLPTLLSVTTIVLFILCVYGVGEMVRGRVAHRLASAYAVAVSRKLFARLGDPAMASKAPVYLRDFAAARQFLASRLFVGLFDLPLVPFYLVLLTFVHPTICLLTLAGLAAMTVAGYLNYKLTETAREATRRADGEAAGFAQSAFSRSGEVRALGMVPNLLTAWGQRMAGALSAGDEAAFISSALYAVSRVIRQAIQVGSMAWGALLVIGGDMSGGMIFLSSMISGRALAPLEQLIGGWETIIRSLEAFNNVEDITGPDKRLQRRPDLPEPRGHLRAKGLVFRDYGRRVVLAGADFEMSPGETVMIDGAPGAGKSILLALLAGARKPEAGQVYLDGAPHDSWPQGQWGKSIGYCGEEAGLLTGTVTQNISRFDPAPDMDEVYRVAKAIGVHGLIVELPDAYQTIISNSADFLPASSRKRIALARAFYGRPKVILLDRPTIFLDRDSEGALLNLLADAKRDGASMAIATQSAMLMRLADRAVTLKEGRVTDAPLPQRPQVRRLEQEAAFGQLRSSPLGKASTGSRQPAQAQAQAQTQAQAQSQDNPEVA